MAKCFQKRNICVQKKAELGGNSSSLLFHNPNLIIAKPIQLVD